MRGTLGVVAASRPQASLHEIHYNYVPSDARAPRALCGDETRARRERAPLWSVWGVQPPTSM